LPLNSGSKKAEKESSVKAGGKPAVGFQRATRRYIPEDRAPYFFLFFCNLFK
jgi:hypothetical protein